MSTGSAILSNAMNSNITPVPQADLDDRLSSKIPVFWCNPSRSRDGMPGKRWGSRTIGAPDVEAAAGRFKRFAPVLRQLFAELESSNGTIRSPLLSTPALEHVLNIPADHGRLLVKADHKLPVAGSIKARGGIHEVLEFAEGLAIRLGLIPSDDLQGMLSQDAREAFGQYQVAVGSTGNLGLSIGVIASAFGFQASVHMSADAKQWKKKRLRNRHVNVVEHTGDYAAAVAAGRAGAEKDPRCHFVDDESSLSLFLGYAAAGEELQQQLAEKDILVDDSHPLFVYIPCGVGGAPSGIAFGLALLFGPNVHCFFAEPVASPCFLVAAQSTSGSHPSVYDVGLDNRTEADGLAVPRASECAVDVMRTTLSGIFTVEDDDLFAHVYRAMVSQGIRIEPSAAAGFDGPNQLCTSSEGRGYLQRHGLEAHMHNATHVIWTTGGLFVPQAEYGAFFDRGSKIMRASISESEQ
ncbi:D-serine ammonia-lyase [Ralstonia sp. 25mfcol4.1]|nr:D-serine ammonia-lyase [Ralstonia sp. 25mfcol4.1]